MALNGERDTPRLEDTIRQEPPVAAGARIWKGGIVVIQNGYAAPGSTATGLLVVGCAEQTVDNTGGGAGARRVKTRRGAFLLKNHTVDPVLSTDIGADCFIVDDETVARTSGSNSRSRAGRVREVENGGVWVEIA